MLQIKRKLFKTQHILKNIIEIHTMQLGINDAFNDTNGTKAVLDNSKGIAKLTHQSTVALEELKKECKAQNVKFRKPKNPNETRWNSSFACMESIFHLRKPLKELMSRDPQWSKFTLNFGEWKLLEGAVKLLKPFMVATQMLEEEKTATMNLVIERIVTLEEVLTRITTSLESPLLAVC